MIFGYTRERYESSNGNGNLQKTSICFKIIFNVANAPHKWAQFYFHFVASGWLSVLIWTLSHCIHYPRIFKKQIWPTHSEDILLMDYLCNFLLTLCLLIYKNVLEPSPLSLSLSLRFSLSFSLVCVWENH